MRIVLKLLAAAAALAGLGLVLEAALAAPLYDLGVND